MDRRHCESDDPFRLAHPAREPYNLRLGASSPFIFPNVAMIWMPFISESGIDTLATALVLSLATGFAALLAQGGGRSRKRSDAMEVLRKISSMVNRSTDLQTMLGAVLDELLQPLGMEAGAFLLHLGRENHPALVITRGLNPSPSLLIEELGDEKGHDGADRKIVAPQILEISEEDIGGSIARAFRNEGMRFLATYPILAGNEVVGQLALASARSRSGVQLHEKLILAAMEMVGAAAGQARMREHTRKLAEDLITLQEINKIITQSFELDSIIRHIVAEGKRLFKSGECHLFLIDYRLQKLVGSASTSVAGPDISSVEWDLNRPAPFVRALHGRRVALFPEAGDAYAAIGVAEESPPWKAALLAPLVTKDEAIGLLAFTRETQDHEYSTEEIGRAESLAYQASIALENARLFHIVSRSQKEWETTFDAMQDNVSLHDMSGRALRANLALARRMKTTPARVIGRSCAELYDAAGGDSQGCRHLARLESEGILVEEIEWPETGSAYQLSVSPWFDKNNRLVGSIHVAKDISRERLLQQQLIQSEKLSAIGELISGIAHELNNPLTGVMGFSQLLLLRKDMDERAKENLLKINNLALRCKKIVDNLLSFARKQKPERNLCDLNEILEKTLDLRGYELQVNNISIRRNLDRSIPKTIADGHQLQQVFLNIITNAEQAMLETHGRGLISIQTRADIAANRIIIEIADSGPGIPEAHLSKIFDPFFTTKEVGKGTGLGLSLAYGIVKEHGGNIIAQSKPGEGAVFIIELPIVARVPQEKTLIPGLIPDALQFEALVRGKKVLVVDDEPYILDYFSEVLGLYPIQVDTADDGHLAMKCLKQNDYDLIISDYRMPNMGGKELFRWVNELRPKLLRRIIFITGDTASDEPRTFFEQAGSRYLSKPFKIEDVREVIRDALSEEGLVEEAGNGGDSG